jgi:LPS export ABC transporter protein LptC
MPRRPPDRRRGQPLVGRLEGWGLAAGVCLLAAGCQGNELAPRRPLTTQADPAARVPDQIIEQGTHILTREGVKKAVMTARRIYFYNVEGKVDSDSVRVTFFDVNGVEESWLTADHGEIDQRTNDMTARGKVLVVSKDGSRIQGDELRYDATRDLIVSEKPVTIFERNNKIQGKGVEADPGLTNIRMSGTSAVLESKPRVGGERRGRAPAAGGAAPGAPGRAAPAGRDTTPGARAGAAPPDSAHAPPGPAPATEPADTAGATPRPARATPAAGDSAPGRPPRGAPAPRGDSTSPRPTAPAGPRPTRAPASPTTDSAPAGNAVAPDSGG